MSDEQPPEKKTVEIAAVPPWAIALTEKVTQGFASVDSRIDALVEEGKTTNQRITRVEVKQEQFERVTLERAEKNSDRARRNTDEDLAREAALAAKIVAAETEARKEREAREALAAKVSTIETKTDAQTQILGTLEKHATGLLNNKAVQALGGLAITAASIALGSWIATHQPKPAPVPAGYHLVQDVDGGAK